MRDVLEGEASGVLAWIVRGYMLYAAEGLEPPEAVKNATTRYKSEEDLAAIFIEECLEKMDNAEIFAGDMYELFRAWFMDNYGKSCPSISTFGRMASKYLVREKRGRKVYLGYDVKPEIVHKYKDKIKWMQKNVF